MGVPIKTSQFAEIWLIGVKQLNASNTDNNLLNNEPVKFSVEEDTEFEVAAEKVGLASSLRINESLGSRTRTVIGTPVPLLVPGFYDGSITMERATINLQSFKNGVNLNPLTAFVPEMYIGGAVKQFKLDSLVGPGPDLPGLNQGLIPTGQEETFYIVGREFIFNETAVPGFLFILVLKDKILREANANNGIYVAMLRDFSVAYSSENALVLENVTAIARPYVQTSWFQILAKTFRTGPSFGYVYAPSHLNDS